MFQTTCAPSPVVIVTDPQLSKQGKTRFANPLLCQQFRRPADTVYTFAPLLLSTKKWSTNWTTDRSDRGGTRASCRPSLSMANHAIATPRTGQREQSKGALLWRSIVAGFKDSNFSKEMKQSSSQKLNEELVYSNNLPWHQF